MGAERKHSKCELTECPTFVVSKYLHQLQQALPCVPPIPDGALKSLHAAKDYKGVVALIKKTMKIECRLVVAWVNSGATKGMDEPPAWIRMPSPMPLYGTKAFRELKLTMFLRKSELTHWSYDQMAIVVAHELSHIVLSSIGHPLRGCEKAVDLTAMVLGFRRLYASGSYKEQRLQNSKSSYQLGYLSPHEVQLANQILAPGDKRSTIKIDSTRRSMMLSVVVLLIVGAVIWINFGSVFTSYPKTVKRECLVEHASAANRQLGRTPVQINTFCSCYSEEIAAAPTRAQETIDLITQRCSHDAFGE